MGKLVCEAVFEFLEYEDTPAAPKKRHIRRQKQIFKNQCGQYHNADGPAIIHGNGSQEWFLNGQRHNPQGPAVIRQNGREEWWLNNLRHRTDGPALIHKNGKQVWLMNGVLHNPDGPAVICSCGEKIWYLNGLLHRSDGPAIMSPNGQNYWYFNGKPATHQVEQWMKKNDVTAYPWDDDMEIMFRLSFTM